ncbi:MAG TPA: GAF domain-containing protein [Candidatus Eisenbacteria bacterium]
MSQGFARVERQRSFLLWLGAVTITAMCAVLALVTWTSQGVALEFDFAQRWPTVVGLCGLVLIFVLYMQHKHHQLAVLDARLRDMAVRGAAIEARFTELSFLFDVTTQLQLRLDLKSMLDLATQRLLPCLEATQSSIMLFDEKIGALEVKAAAGIDLPLVEGARVAPGEGVAGYVFSKGESVLLTPDVVRERFPRDVKPKRTIVGGLCVPMRFRGSPIGVMSVTRTTGLAFEAIHVKMLESFAEHCAATVVKTHHHHEMLEYVKIG